MGLTHVAFLTPDIFDWDFLPTNISSHVTQLFSKKSDYWFFTDYIIWKNTKKELQSNQTD